MIDVHLVVDPWTRESRGFGFVTMENVDVADRCIKYLDRSVLEGRVITVEKVIFVPLIVMIDAAFVLFNLFSIYTLYYIFSTLHWNLNGLLLVL